jgi:hypothetical protein
MNIKIVDGVAKCKFAVLTAIKWRAGVFVSNVVATPIVKGFNEMHAAKLQGIS